jgi:hypothetical protein
MPKLRISADEVLGRLGEIVVRNEDTRTGGIPRGVERIYQQVTCRRTTLTQQGSTMALLAVCP